MAAENQREDDVLRRMLGTPPKPHAASPESSDGLAKPVKRKPGEKPGNAG